MTALSAVFTLLSEDTELQSLGLTVDSIQRSGGTESPEARPFVIIKGGADNAAWGNTGTKDVEIWAYDEPTSYDRIDSILKRVRELMTSAVHVSGADGNTMAQAEWQGDSIDLYDDIWMCATRYSSFRTV